MLRFKAKEPIELYRGVVGLSDAQAAPRQESLRKVGKGRYEILRPIQFKAGEIIGLDGAPKTIASMLVEMPATTGKAQAEVE